MNNWKTLILIIALPFGMSCSQGTEQGETAKTNGQNAESPAELPANAVAFTLPRPMAKTEVDETGTVIHKASPAGFLANGIWHCTGKMAKQNDAFGADATCEGMWMEFKDDGSFSTGHYDTTERTGQWAFGDNIIELIYTDETNRLYGYRIQHGSNAMIFLGSARYQTNPTQMKLERYDSYPVGTPTGESTAD